MRDMIQYIDLDLDAPDTDIEDAIAQESKQDTSGTPLEVLLRLYIRGTADDLYIGYYKGFKRLHEWLSPIALPDRQEHPNLYHPVPRHLTNWDTQEIAKIVGCPQDLVWHLFVQLYQESKETWKCQL